MRTRTKESRPAEGQDMREFVRGRCDLAAAYAEDGAYISALRVVSELQQELYLHVASLKELRIY